MQTCTEAIGQLRVFGSPRATRLPVVLPVLGQSFYQFSTQWQPFRVPSPFMCHRLLQRYIGVFHTGMSYPFVYSHLTSLCPRRYQTCKYLLRTDLWLWSRVYCDCCTVLLGCGLCQDRAEVRLYDIRRSSLGITTRAEFGIAPV